METSPKALLVTKPGLPLEKNQLISYMYSQEPSKDMIWTFDVENGGTWDVNKQSNVYLRSINGRNQVCRGKDLTGCWRERSYGICQTNYRWHSKFIDSPEFKNPYKQVDYCIGVWRDAMKKRKIATTFSAWNVRHEAMNNFNFLPNI